MLSLTWTTLLCDVAEQRFYLLDPVEHRLARGLDPVIWKTECFIYGCHQIKAVKVSIKRGLRGIIGPGLKWI